MKTLKLLIKTNFFNKINDFLCFNIIKYIYQGLTGSAWLRTGDLWCENLGNIPLWLPDIP